MMKFCCGSALEAQRAGTAANKNEIKQSKAKQAALFRARDVRRLMRGGGMEEGWGGRRAGGGGRGHARGAARRRHDCETREGSGGGLSDSCDTYSLLN